MSELGTRLREARVNKGYTLNTLQQMTKIQKKYLQAIEEGKYEEVPGAFYLRAFIKQYADMVGIDGDQLLIEYASELDSPKNMDNRDEQMPEQVERIPSRFEKLHATGEKNQLETMLSYIPLVILSAIILLIILILFFAINDLSKQGKEQPVVEHTTNLSVVESVEPSSTIELVEESVDEVSLEEKTNQLAENQEKVGGQVITKVSEPGSKLTYELEGPVDKYKIGFEPKGYVWIGIYEDGEMVIDQTVGEGEKFEYKASRKDVKEIELEIGYPEGGSFTLNGKKLVPDPDIPLNIKLIAKKPGTGTDARESSDQSSNRQTDQTSGQGVTEAEGPEVTDYQGPAVYDPAQAGE